MADPFSILASTAGLVDISVKFVRFIKKTADGTGTIDEDLRQLTVEVEKLEHVSLLIRNAFEEDMNEVGRTYKNPAADIWSSVSSALKDCEAALAQLHSVLGQVMGEEGSSKFDRLRRHFRKLAKDEEFVELRRRLDRGHQVLQMSLAALNMLVSPSHHTTRRINVFCSIAARQSHIGNSRSIAGLSAQMADNDSKLGQIIRSLESASEGIAQTTYEVSSHPFSTASATLTSCLRGTVSQQQRLSKSLHGSMYIS